ncbi:MAG: sulfite exporter TauE/SafE family protein [Polyangiales bacterium]
MFDAFSTQTTLVLVIAALITSAISGMLGMAGGVTLLGVMASILPPKTVVPLHGVVQLASNLTRTFAYRHDVRWKYFFAFAAPAVIGMALATRLWSAEKLTFFRLWVGVFILAFLVYRRYKPSLSDLPTWVYPVLGFVVGALAIFVGATGPLLAPFFLRKDFSKENVIATKAICQMWVHILKVPAFLSLAFDYRPFVGELALLIVSVIVGTYIGKSLLSRLSTKRFLFVFQFVLPAIHLIVDAIR